MSVALLIPAAEDLPSRLIPIATETVYASEWLPIASRLGLTWLHRFQVGASVNHNDLDVVVGEFAFVGEQFVAEGRPELAERALAVVEALRGVASSRNPILGIYIG